MNVDVKAEIFRACDIRGIVNQSLTEEVAYLIGLSFGTHAIAKGIKQVIIGRDGRHSGQILVKSLSEGLQACGCEVIDVGQVPTPLVYFATYEFQTGTGIMVTGSHNPPNYNGFKMMLGGETLAEDQIQALLTTIQQQAFTLQAGGRYEKRAIIERYIQRLVQDIRLHKPFKIVVDCGSGVVGILAKQLYQALGCEVIELYCEVDGNFPLHHPDPGQPQNLQDLIQTVIKEKADCGLAFDGDGDRLGFVTNQGEIIWPDRVMMLFAKDLLQRKPGAEIIFDVKCSKHLAQTIVQYGGKPVMYKTGHALIKRKMQELNAPLAGEMSGHFFFKERWYGFDDALYSGARLLEVITQSDQDVSQICQNLPNSVSTPEINITIHEDKKFSFIEQLKIQQDFQDVQLITVDGLRVELADGWGLVRASNTTPCLALRFEAENENALARIQDWFKKVILRIAPELSLPF